MWIRRQDKERLIEATMFSTWIGSEQIKLQFRVIAEKEPIAIAAHNTAGIMYLAGIYPTKERALEVLDGIEDKIAEFIRV